MHSCADSLLVMVGLVKNLVTLHRERAENVSRSRSPDHVLMCLLAPQASTLLVFEQCKIGGMGFEGNRPM